MMNITQKTIDTLTGMGYGVTFQDEYINLVEPAKACEMYIGFLKLNENEIQYIGKSIKATKKETTVEYVMDKINAERIYKNFSSEFNKVVRAFGLSAYPTTYGLGISVLFASQASENELKSKVEKALNEIGIIYSTEYSFAGWVFRYKISKSAKNIEVINNYRAN